MKNKNNPTINNYSFVNNRMLAVRIFSTKRIWGIFKILFFPILLLSCSNNSLTFPKNDTDLFSDKLLGKVKEIVIFNVPYDSVNRKDQKTITRFTRNYTAFGQLEFYEYYDDDSITLYTENRYYNKEQEVIKIIINNKIKSQNIAKTHIYNDKKEIIHTQEICINDTLDDAITYERDTIQKTLLTIELITKNSKPFGKFQSQYKFNNEGRTIYKRYLQLYFENNEEYENIDEYKYDNNSLIEKKHKSQGDVISYIYEYKHGQSLVKSKIFYNEVLKNVTTYTKFENPVKSVDYESIFYLAETEYFEYEYDKFDNWVSRKVKTSQQKYIFDEKKIEQYNEIRKIKYY